MYKKIIGFLFLGMAAVAAVGIAISGQGGFGFVPLVIIVLMAAPFFRSDSDDAAPLGD